MYPSKGRSISATPPPREVEFTLQMTRPLKRSRAVALAAWSAAYWAGSAIPTNASSDLSAIGTSKRSESGHAESCTVPMMIWLASMRGVSNSGDRPLPSHGDVERTQENDRGARERAALFLPGLREVVLVRAEVMTLLFPKTIPGPSRVGYAGSAVPNPPASIAV